MGPTVWSTGILGPIIVSTTWGSGLGHPGVADTKAMDRESRLAATPVVATSFLGPEPVPGQPSPGERRASAVLGTAGGKAPAPSFSVEVTRQLFTYGWRALLY